MVREIVHDPIFLALPSADALGEDASVADDLLETLRANADRCVGMAANMIGERKKIIAVNDNGTYLVMFNPVIVGKREPFQTEEGCLSLDGLRSVTRYRMIRVRWQDRSMKQHEGNFIGFTAQIIQHEIDHCAGILI